MRMNGELAGGRISAVSVVIPVYRDEEALGHLLPRLSRLVHRPREILVADGGDSIRIRALCRKYGARYISSLPCRGIQLDAGARRSSGDVLWFLHADADIKGDPLTAIEAALAGGACGGFFRFRFAGERPWPASLLERLVALRVRFGVPYGDQGLFMTRDAYFGAGGYPPWPLFEEVPLVRGLRKRGKFLSLEEPIFVDPRRWERDGWWRRSFLNRWLAAGFLVGVSPERLSKRYRVCCDQKTITTMEEDQ